MHLKQEILQGAHKHGALVFNLLLIPCICLGQNYNQKMWRNNMVFTPLTFQDNLLCIFADFQQKVQNKKGPITYW